MRMSNFMAVSVCGVNSFGDVRGLVLIGLDLFASRNNSIGAATRLSGDDSVNRAAMLAVRGDIMSAA